MSGREGRLDVVLECCKTADGRDMAKGGSLKGRNACFIGKRAVSNRFCSRNQLARQQDNSLSLARRVDLHLLHLVVIEEELDLLRERRRQAIAGGGLGAFGSTDQNVSVGGLS